MMKSLFPILLLVVAASGCHGKDRDNSTTPPDSTSAAAPELALPVVPDSIRDIDTRLRFVIDRFWDSMDWNDTSAIDSDSFMEQNLANFYQLLAMANDSAKTQGVKTLINAATVNPHAVERIADISERYLYSMDSPMYNPQSYLAFIEALMDSKATPETMRRRLAYNHKALMSNREGSKAADFTFQLPNGSNASLSGNVDRRTILMFYDSDCEVCARIEKMLGDSPAINGAIANGSLRIVAIDTFTASKDEWAKKAAHLPTNWVVGYSPDGAIDSEEIYFIRTTPTIYLLDADMTVLIKDVDDATLQHWVSEPPVADNK